MRQKIIQPQKGYQMMALSSSADIVIGGGAAGSGKTVHLLLEPIRHKDVDNFGAVIFRRTYPMITAEGGLWDASQKIFGYIHGATSRESFLDWKIGKAKVKFAHLQHEKNIYDWQGSEIPLIEFDELTHFTKKMFFYLLTRNRSTCGVRPFVRATCNPDPDSWVAELVDWWIDPLTGFPIPERQGVLRYFMTDNDTYIWGDTPEEVIEKGWHVLKGMVERSGLDPKIFIKSITYIGGSIYDNAELLKVNPEYLANLNSQSEEDKLRLLEGNWKVKISDVDIYDYYKFQDIFTNTGASRGVKRITSDIATEGSDTFVIYVWDGNVLIDFEAYDKSCGAEIIDHIKDMAKKHGVPYSNIAVDSDGVGSFIGSKDPTKGFIPGAVQFNNGGSPMPDPKNPLLHSKTKKPIPEPYPNLKTQCYYRSGFAVERGELYIPEEVANRMVNDERTFRQQLMFERKAIKRANPDADGRKKIIDKAAMKVILGGKSPDFLDALMMKEVFSLSPPGRKPKARF